MRLDQYIAEKCHISRSKAQDYIANKFVYINNILVIKDSFQVKEEDNIELRIDKEIYVSRGGYKLEKAIEVFNLDFKGKVVVDIGSSTGGFTDCALQFGAKKIYAIDVGKEQLDQKLKNNSNVVSIEETNFNDMPKITEEIDYFVADVSFVSILEIFRGIKKQEKKARVVGLIKPQFEVGKGNTKKGIVKDQKLHIMVLKKIFEETKKIGFSLEKITSSPIKGRAGNVEYLALFTQNNINISFDFKRIVEEAFKTF